MKVGIPCCFGPNIRQDIMTLEMHVEQGCTPQGGQETERQKENIAKIEP